MKVEDLESLSDVALLAGIESASRERLLRHAYLQRFPAQVELVGEGDPADFLHVVVDGRAEAYSHWRDKETTIAVLGRGDSFIMAAVVTDRPNLQSARTLESSRILLIPAEIVREVFAADHVFAQNVAFELARSYRAVIKELKNQKVRSAIERLGAWLLHEDERTGGHGVFDLPFDKKVLAARIGVQPEVLSRTFASLAAYGVTVSGKRVTIDPKGGLCKLAGPSKLLDDPQY